MKPIDEEHFEEVQSTLFRLAKTANWSNRMLLFQEEEPLAQQCWVSLLKHIADDPLSDIAQRYLALTSLPFRIIWDDRDVDVYYQAAACEAILRHLWKVREFDDTAVLPTGNMAPEYFVVGSVPENSDINRSFVTHNYLRKALLKAGIYNDSWFTHIIKFPKMTVTQENVTKHSTLLYEIEMLRPRIVLLLGRPGKIAIKYLTLPSDVLVVHVSSPEEYVKHGHPFDDYAEAIKTVIAVAKEKKCVSK